MITYPCNIIVISSELIIYFSSAQAFMRRVYTDVISKSVLEQLDLVELSDIKIDVSAPYLKHMLATSFAKALSELPSDKVIACWAPLQEAWDNKEASHAEAKKELIRLFPNHSGRPLPASPHSPPAVPSLPHSYLSSPAHHVLTFRFSLRHSTPPQWTLAHSSLSKTPTR